MGVFLRKQCAFWTHLWLWALDHSILGSMLSHAVAVL